MAAVKYIFSETRRLRGDLQAIKQQTLYLQSEMQRAFSELRNYFSLPSTSASSSEDCCELQTLDHIETSPQESVEVISIESSRKILSGSSLECGITLKSVGTFRSCFLTKNGTPRQPNLCSYARGCLTITCFNNPGHSLEHISTFSHLWLVFVFHENRQRGEAKTKVAPPRLNGEKVGVFATRSPHRPNPIGLSLVKLDSVSDGTLFVSGVDLIDRTPILDIKPYIHEYDTPITPFTTPDWISNPPSLPLSVEFSDTSLLQIAELNYAANYNVNRTASADRKHRNCTRFIRSETEMVNCIRDIISADPRSTYRRKQADTVFSFLLDSVDVKVGVTGCIVKVLDVSQTAFLKKLLNK